MYIAQQIWREISLSKWPWAKLAPAISTWGRGFSVTLKFPIMSFRQWGFPSYGSVFSLVKRNGPGSLICTSHYGKWVWSHVLLSSYGFSLFPTSSLVILNCCFRIHVYPMYLVYLDFKIQTCFRPNVLRVFCSPAQPTSPNVRQSSGTQFQGIWTWIHIVHFVW